MSTKQTAPQAKRLPSEITLDVIKNASAEQIRVWVRAYGAAAVK
jgi:hypothetical protein